MRFSASNSLISEIRLLILLSDDWSSSSLLSAILYLVSGILFILALRGLSSPETSRQGNLFGIVGMIIAISVTFLSVGNFSSGFIYVLIFLAILIPWSIGRRYSEPNSSHDPVSLFQAPDCDLSLV